MRFFEIKKGTVCFTIMGKYLILMNVQMIKKMIHLKN